MRVMPYLLVALGVVAVLEIAANLIVRPQTGLLALAAVLEPYLLGAGAVAAVVGLVLLLGSGSRPASWARLAGIVVVLVAIVRLGGEWWSPGVADAPGATATAGPEARAPAGGSGATGQLATGAAPLRVLSWNLELGSRAASASVEGIAEREVDLVALQELTPAVAAAIEADPGLVAAFPYRVLEPRAGVDGMGLLSRLPLVVGGVSTGPLVLRAGLLLPDGRRVEAIDVHPYPASITRAAGLPAGLDTRRRDADLGRIRAAVEALDDPALALVVGDLNATPFEAGFATLAGGLHDAHGEAGIGTGATWRPSSLERFGLGLLRIDVVLSGDALRPVAVDEDCRLPGDHCRLYATLAVFPPAP